MHLLPYQGTPAPRLCYQQRIPRRTLKNQAAKASVPIALQLDHAKKTETIEKAIEAGFSKCPADRKRPGAGPFDL